MLLKTLNLSKKNQKHSPKIKKKVENGEALGEEDHGEEALGEKDLWDVDLLEEDLGVEDHVREKWRVLTQEIMEVQEMGLATRKNTWRKSKVSLTRSSQRWLMKGSTTCFLLSEKRFSKAKSLSIRLFLTLSTPEFAASIATWTLSTESDTSALLVLISIFAKTVNKKYLMITLSSKWESLLMKNRKLDNLMTSERCSRNSSRVIITVAMEIHPQAKKSSIEEDTTTTKKYGGLLVSLEGNPNNIFLSLINMKISSRRIPSKNTPK